MRRFVLTLIALKLTLVVGFLVLFVASETAVQEAAIGVATPSPRVRANDTINRPTSQPYTGDLSIFEDENRAKNLQIDRVMDILGISEKKNVADIGAGSGWFTVRAAKRIGTGTVFAVEINQKYIDHINSRVRKENLPNIKTILGRPNDPMLPLDAVDAVMVLKTYHEIAEPIRLMKNVRKSLKPGALVAIIDKNGVGDDHGLDQESVIKEMKQAGFKLRDQFDFVKADGMDYFLVFEIQK